uniref:Uncharacterized protein n=1 Tax=Sphaerodactylus townsendi TaxID=933632 RepID=A0ACB8F3J6_9SAUR
MHSMHLGQELAPFRNTMELRRTYTTAAIDDSIDGMERTPDQEAKINNEPMKHCGSSMRRGPRKGFKIEFNGDPNDLAFFLIQVSSYLEIHGDDFRSDRDRVFEIGTRLGGEAANWLISLVEEDAPEIHDLEQFLLALRHRFEDPLVEEKAQAAV